MVLDTQAFAAVTMLGKSGPRTWKCWTSIARPRRWARQARPSLAPDGQGRPERGPASAGPAAASAARDRARIGRARAREGRPAWGRVIVLGFPNVTVGGER